MAYDSVATARISTIWESIDIKARIFLETRVPFCLETAAGEKICLDHTGSADQAANKAEIFPEGSADQSSRLTHAGL